MNMEKRYWIGDPCYVVSDDDWDLFCSGTASDELGEYVDYHGQRIYFHSAGGDGEWSFNCGKFCVDSGIFAVIDLSLMPPTMDKDGLALGILFDSKPDLDTDNYTVIINGEKDFASDDDDDDEWW
tara:strand:+ start:354 stop:728 length:375 start_codon:yes stop_codon:yes gene_type:complete